MKTSQAALAGARVAGKDCVSLITTPRALSAKLARRCVLRTHGQGVLSCPKLGSVCAVCVETGDVLCGVHVAHDVCVCDVDRYM